MQNSMAAIGKLQVTARRDLRFQVATNRENRLYYHVLDPLTRHSYRIGELERAILEALRTHQSLNRTLKHLRRIPQFASITDQQFAEAIERLQRSGLVRVANHRKSPPSTVSIQAARIQSTLASFVSWQLRGLQPDRWLARAVPYTDALFSQQAVQFWLIASLVTLCSVLLEFHRLETQANAWQWILHPVQGGSLFVIFLLTRALHELGHALVCKRHGVRCPDIGVFVILGAPCVYCDVSESWQLPSRWQRAAVAAAGMYVELIIATMAAWLWMITVDGPANTLALQTMFVCSVSTLLINANPLMRFDGYYILSDLLEETNLRGRADALSEAWLVQTLLGRRLELVDKREMPGSRVYALALVAFSWVGWVYRACLSLAMAGLLVAIYESWNLAWFGRSIAAMVLVSWWGVPSMKLLKKLIHHARRSGVQGRLAIVALACLAMAALLPIPYRQFSTGWVQPTDLQGIYASGDGIVNRDFQQQTLTAPAIDQPPSNPLVSGQLVSTGKPLFRIADLATELQSIKAHSEFKIAEQRLMSSQAGAHVQRAVRVDMETAKAALEIARQQVENSEQERSRLLLRVPRDGKLLLMPVNAGGATSDLQTDALNPTWGSPEQLGRRVTVGTMLAAVCDSRMTAILPLSDEQLEWIAAGTEVRVRCSESGSAVYRAEVKSIVPLKDATAAWRIVHSDSGAAAGSANSKSQVHRQEERVYAALVELPGEAQATTGCRVDAVFIVPSQTLLDLGTRWMKQNFRWLAD